MTSEEKVFEILTAKDDKELYAATSRLTANQKDIVIASLVKALKMYAGVSL